MDNIEQKTDEWHQLRCGKFTGSRFADVLAVSKKDGKPLKARDDLIWTLASERLQGYQAKGANSYSMRWGTENEPLAREAYELETGAFVEEQAFILHPAFDFVGISPDGLVDLDGGIEIKCPSSPEIHLQRWVKGVPPEYMAQIQGAMWVTGRAWWDFVSYDPDTKDEFQLLIIRVERNEQYIADLEAQIILAEKEVNELIESLNNLRKAA